MAPKKLTSEIFWQQTGSYDEGKNEREKEIERKKVRVSGALWWWTQKLKKLKWLFFQISKFPKRLGKSFKLSEEWPGEKKGHSLRSKWTSKKERKQPLKPNQRPLFIGESLRRCSWISRRRRRRRRWRRNRWFAFFPARKRNQLHFFKAASLQGCWRWRWWWWMQFARPPSSKKKSTRQKTFLFQACGDRSGNGPLTEIAECRTRHSWSRDSIASRRLPSATSNRARHRRFAPRTAVGRFSGVAKSGKKQNGFKKVPTTCAGIDRNPRREPKKKFRKKNRCSKVFFGETPVSRRTTAPRFGFRQRALLRSRSNLKKVEPKPKT